jgi:predicted transcriptional regulator
MTEPALRAVAATADRLHAAEDAQREAIRAASEVGASLRQIAAEAGLSHEQVRRIVQGESVAPYFVTVERQGVSPLEVQLLVRGPSKRAAGELASWIAERSRGGIFEATKIRRAARKASAFPAATYDDADL